MAVTWQDVVDIAPELSGIDTARITRFINRAKLSVNQDVFGRAYDLAVTYLAAHMLSVSPEPQQGQGQQAQIVTSEKVGDLARTYQQSSQTTTEAISLARTRYGDEFLRLRKQCVISPIVITQSGDLNQ